MSGADGVLFRFESPGVTVEFEGPQEFVEAQMERLAERIRHEIGAALARSQGAAGGGNVAGDGSPAVDVAAAAPSPAPSPAPAPAATGGVASNDPPARPERLPPPSLAEFHRRARSREGRGALQETILIFAYYMTEIRGQSELTIDDIASCFTLADAAPPRNLANTMGIMKRSQSFFDAGPGRGRYVLTEKGVAYVRRLIGTTGPADHA